MTTTTKPGETRFLAHDEAPPAAAPAQNLYQRLAAVAGEVGKIAATGKNQFNKAAVSIYDVENALRDELAAHGILTRWSVAKLENLDSGKLWLIVLRLLVVNADDPQDNFEDVWQDVGNTPAGAASFARKGYYRALFHLATEDDDKRPAPASAWKPPAPPPPRPDPAVTTSVKAPQHARTAVQGSPAAITPERQALIRGFSSAYNAGPREGTRTRNGILADHGWDTVRSMTEWRDSLSDDALGAVIADLSVPVGSGSDVDPSEIPFRAMATGAERASFRDVTWAISL